MISFFQNLRISPASFWLGLLCGILLAWLFSRLRLYLPKIIKLTGRRLGEVRDSLSTGADVRYRNDIYRFAQKQHLAASLFSLDEIVVEPKVLTPLLQSPGSADIFPTDSVSTTLPYIPDWPEMASVYRASTMGLLDALQGGANIILAGNPGYGKSVALAWLASCIARNDPGLGKLAGKLPLYVHTKDLYQLFDDLGNSPANPENLSSIENPSQGIVKNAGQAVDMLIEAMTKKVSPLTAPRLSRLVNTALKDQTAILLLDQVDELPPGQAAAITSLLQILLDKYPQLRIVVAMSYDNLAGLPTLGFSLLALAGWNENDRINFLRRWVKNWIRWFAAVENPQSGKVDAHFLNSWLSDHNSFLSPLEYTLKVWAAFSGDILGSDIASSIESYLRRTTNEVSHSRPGLERFALQLLVEMAATSNPADTARLKAEYELEIKSSSTIAPPQEGDAPLPIPIKPPIIKDVPGVDELTDKGLLVSYPGSRYGFCHPLFAGYLAGRALSISGVVRQVQNQPAWTMKSLSLNFLAKFGDVTPLIHQFLQDDDLIHSNHLLIARWLQYAPKNRTWRTVVLRTLSTILQKEKETISLSAKIISAMALAGDAGVAQFFRTLLKSDHLQLKQLAALGCGLMMDKKATGDLNQLLQEQSPASVRSAALALTEIGDKQSLEILAYILLNGNELQQRSAAEALANERKDGYRALKDGSALDDLMVRRSVIYGLIRINQPWANKIIENLQLEDNEWVVRNAAIQVFDELHKKNLFAPHPIDDPTEIQWLIDYALKHGTTVAPGKPGQDLITKALVNGSQEEKLNALSYITAKCDPQSMSLVLKTYTNSADDLRDSAYYLLWLLTITGVKIPYTFD